MYASFLWLKKKKKRVHAGLSGEYKIKLLMCKDDT